MSAIDLVALVPRLTRAILFSVASLPLPLLIALIYRITVLHAASRIIIFIRKRTTGWEEPTRSATSPIAAGESEAARGVFWNGQKLSEEPPVRRSPGPPPD